MTRLVCVYLLCDKFLFNPILLNLPRLLAMSADDEAASRWIQTNVSYIAAEAAAGKPGSACLVSRLAELLFIEVLRRHVASLRGDGTGWLAALGDRHLSHALAALHARPEHAWTVSELALHSRLSRSALVQRFHRMLDIAPMRYLALWRLQLAAQALQSTDKGIAAIAAEIGYGSEEAFSRAFKRHADASPAVWRRARRNGAG